VLSSNAGVAATGNAVSDMQAAVVTYQAALSGSSYNLYYSSYSTAPNVVIFNGTLLTQVSSKTALATGTWWLDTTDSRIYIYDNPASQTVEASQRNYCIDFNTENYITLNGISCYGAIRVGIRG
jgi:hypothetical protein